MNWPSSIIGTRQLAVSTRRKIVEGRFSGGACPVGPQNAVHQSSNFEFDWISPLCVLSGFGRRGSRQLQYTTRAHGKDDNCAATGLVSLVCIVLGTKLHCPSSRRLEESQ